MVPSCFAMLKARYVVLQIFPVSSTYGANIFLIPSCLIFQEEISIYMALVFVLEYDVAN